MPAALSVVADVGFAPFTLPCLPGNSNFPLISPYRLPCLVLEIPAQPSAPVRCATLEPLT
ncbi:hypothetical protein RSAG8_03877, partial [Rhizoctonia solani AG-8 WAC10335]